MKKERKSGTPLETKIFGAAHARSVFQFPQCVIFHKEFFQ